MTKRLENKRAIVTGGAKGIGKATVELFVLEGAKVYFCDKDRKAGESLAADIGENVFFKTVDVSDEISVAGVVSDAVGWLGGLDVLINDAGVGGVGLPKLLEDLSIETWEKTINTNLKGTFLVSKYCLPHIAKKGGSIVKSGFHIFCCWWSQTRRILCFKRWNFSFNPKHGD